VSSATKIVLTVPVQTQHPNLSGSGCGTDLEVGRPAVVSSLYVVEQCCGETCQLWLKSRTCGKQFCLWSSNELSNLFHDMSDPSNPKMIYLGHVSDDRSLSRMSDWMEISQSMTDNLEPDQYKIRHIAWRYIEVDVCNVSKPSLTT